MDFGALPPEVNSARMYAGPGAGPMMAAAAAWNTLAAELVSTAAGYESVITELTGEWLGSASASMAAAVQPYVAWLNVTAGHAQRAASQATASAAAFETAFAATVPPPVIAANRAQLAALVATNFLGVNTPAIMATEAHYAEMWAQDAAAMYGYAASSAIAGILNPLTPPAPTATPAGQAGLMQTIASLPNAVAALASPAAAVPAQATPVLGYPIVANTINGLVNATSWWVMNTIPNSVLLSHAINGAPATALAATTAPAVAPAGATGLGGAQVLAGLGRASTVGGLSVPAGWSAAAPATSPAASASAGSGWAVAPEEATPVTAVPAGMPMAMAGTTSGLGGPRYGFKPTVMPKSVLV
ncbi:PPE family protein [Mycobacterium sp.]|uniref:PPE family protein n=1 Tax=Mycobacterium sp. TaxID=1785 RepID=UPI002BA5A8B6|nr:PPE family protein [Mycobacterium sp.]HTY31588.1 PPE family protein [Mycobacterium sp.]